MRTAWILAAMMAVASAADAQSRDPFPHQRHERLFPLCESCHAGIATGDAGTSMPPEASCRECHNGTDAAVVTWRRPEKVTGLLRYSHPSHASETDSAGRACVTCHGSAGAPMMAVHRATPESCLGCHTHRATAHLDDGNRCATCHVPLTAATGLSAERVARLPKPPSHERADFAAAHQPSQPVGAASCATCHARESCSRCHVNAASQAIIASLGRDRRVAALMAGRPAAYPVPSDHAREDFPESHGAAATRNAARCAACHARQSCTTCHMGSGASVPVLARMPVPEPGGARGVLLRLMPARPRAGLVMQAGGRGDTSVRLVRVHAAGFSTQHAAQAASRTLTCEGCHEQRFCSDCHAGEGQRRFHPSNFTQRHAADAWGRESDCASCHNAELFCRSCHRESGLASSGRLDVAYHNAQPQWLLQHGRAARQGLQSCTTCHVQKDCMTCHATTGWGVSPHGPDFKASRLANRNATQCLLCHLRVPGR